MPHRAGLERQWQAGPFRNDRPEAARRIIQEPRVALLCTDGEIFEKVVGQSTGVGPKVAHLHRTQWILVDETAVAGKHLGCAERRNELCHRVSELEAALFVEGHQGGVNHWLDHRIHAEDRVFRHWHTRFAILLTYLVRVDDLAPTGDRRADACVSVVINVTLHHRPDPGQTPTIHPDRFWNDSIDACHFGCSFNGVTVAHCGSLTAQPLLPGIPPMDRPGTVRSRGNAVTPTP